MRCPFCDHRFESADLISLGPGVSYVSGNRITCPECGRLAEQELAGAFDVGADGTWTHLATALASPEATAANLLRLREIISNAQTAGADKEQIAQEVKLVIPALGPVADFINSVSGDRLALWLGVILIVLVPLIMAKIQQPAPAPAPATTVNIVVQQPSEAQVQEWIRDALQSAGQVPAAAPSRNSRCPCGSGKRYKRCHGVPAGPRRQRRRFCARAAFLRCGLSCGPPRGHQAGGGVAWCGVDELEQCGEGVHRLPGAGLSGCE